MRPRRSARHFLILASAIAIGAAGCGKSVSKEFLVKPLSKPNPTSYVFDQPIEEVGKTLRSNVSRLLKDQMLMFETKENPIYDWSSAILRRPGNEYDAVLYNGIHSKMARSSVYALPDGSSCLYGADYHVHLSGLDGGKTKVEVFASRPTIYVGEEERSTGIPFLWSRRRRKGIFVKVRPTTVEEYTILLNIGEALGVGSMPAMNQPGSGGGAVKVIYKEKDIIDFEKDRQLDEWEPLDWKMPGT